MSEIAVVIPCFKAGGTLRETLDSVKSQTRPPTEVVIVDDGSIDQEARELLAALNWRETTVLVTHCPEASAAWNHGVAMTTAAYVLLLDTDCFIEPAFLERTAARLDSDFRLGLVSTALQTPGNAATSVPRSSALACAVTRLGVPSTVLFRRQLWDAARGFDEQLPQCADFDFWCRASECDFGGEILEEPLIRCPIPSNSSRYREVQAGTFRAVRQASLRRHRPALEREGPDLLIQKERLIVDQWNQRRSLEDRRAALETDLAAIEEQIGALSREIASAGGTSVDLGDFRRMEPIGTTGDQERALMVDQYYIEVFLGRHRDDIRNFVLDVKSHGYERLEGARVTPCDAGDIDPLNMRTIAVGDLRTVHAIADNTYDCILLTQILHTLTDPEAALSDAYRILKPGGVLLATLPVVSAVNHEDGTLGSGDYWRFTAISARRLLSACFSASDFSIEEFGNVRACTAFLFGLPATEIPAAELDFPDPDRPLILGVRAVKRELSDGLGRDRSSERPTDVRIEGGGGVILAYHRVACGDVDPHRLCLDPRAFREQMEHLAAAYQPIGLQDLLCGLATGGLPPRAVAVTFDDGNVDALETASPILLELGIPATFFVMTEALDREHETWWDTLARVFLSDETVPDQLRVQVEAETLTFPTHDYEQRATAHSALHRRLICAALPVREAVIADVIRWVSRPVAPRNAHRVMLGSELRTLASRPGHTIGAHTVHHLALSAQDIDTQEYEIGECRRTLETLLGTPVTLCSYPYGYHDDATRAIVKRHGFLGAVGVETGLVHPSSDPFALRRVSVRTASRSRFADRLLMTFRGVTVA